MPVEYAIQLLDHYKSRFLALYEGFKFKAIISAQDLMLPGIADGCYNCGTAKASWNY